MGKRSKINKSMNYIEYNGSVIIIMRKPGGASFYDFCTF